MRHGFLLGSGRGDGCGRAVNGTGHQAANAAAGMGLVYWQRPTAAVGAALVGGMVAAARGPDQLEFRRILNGVRRRKTARLAKQLGKDPLKVTQEEREAAGIMRWHIRHRGPTHWLVTGLAVALLAGLLAGMVVQTQPVAGWIAVGVMLGYWLHAVGDALTELPVQFMPGVWTHLSPAPLRFKAGGFVEGVLTLACTFVVVYLAVKLAPADWQERAVEAGR